MVRSYRDKQKYVFKRELVSTNQVYEFTTFMIGGACGYVLIRWEPSDVSWLNATVE